MRQKKTGRPVRFELSEQTRQAVDDYLKAANKRPGEFLFTGRRGAERSMTTRQHARLVSEWIDSVGLYGNAKATIAYAWSSPLEGTTKRRFFTVLHQGPVKSPVDAVRAAIVAESKGRS